MPSRLGLNECRELLGAAAEGMTDEKVTEIRDWLYNLSSVLIDTRADLMQRAEQAGLENCAAVDLILNALREQMGVGDLDSEQSEVDSEAAVDDLPEVEN